MAADAVVDAIVDAVRETRLDDLAAGTRAAACYRVADSIGCALSGFGSTASRAAWAVATSAAGQDGYVIGRPTPVSLESAVFCNTAMMRCQDYNDSYNQVGSGHPSDLIGVALAVAGQVNIDGSRLLAAVVGAYDALCGMWDHTRIGRVVWDQGTMVGPVSAALAGTLLGLDRQQVSHAVAMSAVSSISVRQTRQSTLSMWKNLATAFAARGGVTTALLASHGATGPDRPFLGSHGVGSALFTDTADTVSLPTGAIIRTNLKFYPCCYHAHTSAELASEAARRVDADRIGRISVRTYAKAFNGLAADPEKWRPTTVETADHSLPYVIAAALHHGRIDETTFDPVKFTDPAIVALMDKVSVAEDPALSAAFPDLVRTRLEIDYAPGERAFDGQLDYPKGHHRRPFPAGDLEAKFLALGARAYRDQAKAAPLREIYARFLTLEDEPDVAALLRTIPPADRAADATREHGTPAPTGEATGRIQGTT